MGEAARVLVAHERVLPGAWLRAVGRANVPRRARQLARLLATFPTFPRAFPSLRVLGRLLDPERPLSVDQVRRLVRALERAGLLEHAERHSKRPGGDRRQLSNLYQARMPEAEVAPEPTFARGPLAKCQGSKKREREGFPSPSLAENFSQSSRAEPARTPARTPARESTPVSTAALLPDLREPTPEPTPPARTPPPKPPRTPPQSSEKAATRPERAGEGDGLLSEVVESFSRLPGGSDALPPLRRASLTPDEQRAVLTRTLEVKPRHAGRFVHGLIAEQLARRARVAEASAAVEHDYVPDGGRFPDALRAPPGHLDARVSRPRTWKPPPPPPGDPRELELARVQAHAAFLRKAEPGHRDLARLEAEAADLEAELARQKARGGLRLVT